MTNISSNYKRLIELDIFYIDGLTELDMDWNWSKTEEINTGEKLEWVDENFMSKWFTDGIKTNQW